MRQNFNPGFSSHGPPGGEQRLWRAPTSSRKGGPGVGSTCHASRHPPSTPQQAAMRLDPRNPAVAAAQLSKALSALLISAIGYEPQVVHQDPTPTEGPSLGRQARQLWAQRSDTVRLSN